MTTVMDRLRKKLREFQSSDDRAEERLTCPDCTGDFTRYEVLNNTNRCPQCGMAIDVDTKPKVFS